MKMDAATDSFYDDGRHEQIEVPEEQPTRVSSWIYLKDFVMAGCRLSQQKRSLLVNHTEDEDNMTYFKIEALIKFLRNNKFETYSRTDTRAFERTKCWWFCQWFKAI